MTRSDLHKSMFRIVLCLLVCGFAVTMAAQSVKVEGLIIARSGDQVTVKFGGGAELTFVLTDRTEVSQIGGLTDASRQQRAMEVLLPGLKVKAEGVYNEQRQVLATSIKFKNGDLEDAQKAQAGIYQVKVQSEQHQQELEKQNAELRAQNQALQQQQAQLTEQQQKVEANKAAIAANEARFGQLDDYYIWDEVTVLFGNGKVEVDPQYVTQLLALAEKAKPINGYVIEVIGYASSAGSVALNQKLSQQRADNVTNILVQQGHIPLTRMLAPGAMGEAHQVGTDQTAEGQSENRRVVVRVLQNKAIAGV